MGTVKIKKELLLILKDKDFQGRSDDICRLGLMKAANALFSFFYSVDETVRWRAITAMGIVASALAREDMERARVVMRRLMWSLNDESGGIGWGAPEALGEIMAKSLRLSREYAFTFSSALDPKGNFIEHPELQKGVLWGFGRLARKRASLLRDCAPLLVPFFKSRDPSHRGLAVWAAGPLNEESTNRLISGLTDDSGLLSVYIDMEIINLTVGRLAREAIEKYMVER